MKKILVIIFSYSIFLACVGQTISRDDYKRAVSFLPENLRDNHKVGNLYTSPNWFSDSTGFWFWLDTKEGGQYYQLSLKTLSRSLLFDHAKLAAQLSDVNKKKVGPFDLGLNNLTRKSQDTLEFTFNGKMYNYLIPTNVLQVATDKPGINSNQESISPDGKWIAYTENYNLFIRSTENGQIRQLSFKGEKNYEYASYYGWSDIMEGEGGERPKRFFVRWSPDSRWVQTSICDLRNARKMFLLDWGVDTLYRARLLSYYRGSPGDTTVVYLKPIAFNVQTGKEISINVPRMAHETGYSFQWMSKPGVGIISYSDRGFQQAHLKKIDFNTGQIVDLFTESSKTNTNGFEYWIYKKANVILIASEKSGWRQLYTIDMATNVVKPLTNGAYYVTEDLHLDENSATLYFGALGKEEGKNPYQQYFYSVSLSGKNLKLLTPEKGNHQISISVDNKYFVDNYSTPSNGNVCLLKDLKTGKKLSDIAASDLSSIEAMGWKPPEAFTAVGKDGTTPIYGLLYKPTNFTSAKKYPVIDATYTGPHTHIVPGTMVRTILSQNQALAELGFIVMVVDGMGTAHRSKAFHDYSYKKMGYNLEDHVGAIRQMAKTKSWLDTTRVGIFGHSAGGYDAGHALLQFPDFYKVGVASSADHDFRMEKAWWPEMYMGWPVDSTYHQQSNITMAGNLKGKLLITHGGIDENVNPSATFKLAEMLVRADKQFDMLIFPSQRHGYQGLQQKYFTKVRWNYFVKHLLGAEPIWDFEWK